MTKHLRFRAYGGDGQVVAAGDCNAKGVASFNSGATVVERVVFYSGPQDGESVVGEEAVAGVGRISIRYYPPAGA